MRRLLLAGSLLLLAIGCTTRPARVGEPPPKVSDSKAEAEYQRILDRYSAQKEAYKLFDTRIFVGATHQAWPMREARTRRLALFQVWPEALLAEKLKTERDQHEARVEFFFGVHVNNPDHEDFDKKNSIWRIALVTPAGEFAPSEIHRLGRSTLDMRALYPYMDDFWVGYRVSFPRQVGTVEVVPPGTSKLTFRVASTVGQAELELPAE